MYQNILLPLDLGEEALTAMALEQVKAVIRSPDTRVRLMYVVAQIPDFILNRFNPQTNQFDDVMSAELRSRLQALADTLALPAENISVVVRQGGIYDEILKEAQCINADLILIGSRRPSMKTYLLGSNAAAIVRHARTSVLVAR
ncbi:Nucleotide-binding universal stress protein, UspA family [Edwardsiella anguillarum]|uniref:universal stress protein n=1 Tax=Edwardsiella TaxID=635 RepID=UPI00045C8C7E|nr:universal stress protein [Edwardsiella anguillarum]AKM48048.1 universal stress protein UspA [Edwardsiella sp. EA181011]GAJ68370.1 universal stress protein G [Edwardsiella piscicida]RFT03864.1 universal stress protein UspA [Edwardsiella anguillarum]BET80695.1 Nucleotide-binding universal stress protein, UspA family [Edwardsiella anguillarum]BET83984.1 Nucleotide-binding universal stress protein, UspA family [Edwardsiella anguillarum]